MFSDLRFGARMVRKRPGASLAAILTLGAGMGAAASTFSVADALVFRPIQIKEIDRIVSLFTSRPGQQDSGSLNPSDFLDWQRHTTGPGHLFQSTAAFDNTGFNTAGDGEAERVDGARVTADFFDLLATEAQLGRRLVPQDNQPGQSNVVVLSHRLWTRRFGSDPTVIGRDLFIDGLPHRIAGVMPKDFTFPPTAELWKPLVFAPSDLASRRPRWLEAVGRLNQGVSVSQANAKLLSVSRHLAKDYPDTNRDRDARAALLRENLSGDLTYAYTMLMLGAVAFVLLIACVNVANLQLAHVSQRTRELSIRLAMGAARWRLIAQLLAESVVLALAGSLSGLLFASWSMDLIHNSLPAEVRRFLPGWDLIGVNYRVLAFLLSVAVGAGILAGLAPAISASRTDLAVRLREGGRGSTGGRRRHRLTQTLVVLQMVLSVVLLVGAGLMVKGFRGLLDATVPFAPDRLLILRTTLTGDRHATLSQVSAFAQTLEQQLGALPGATAAAIISSAPYADHGLGEHLFRIDGGAPPLPGESPSTRVQSATPEAFPIFGLRLLRGRLFSASDGSGTPPVGVISDTLARRYFSGQDPVGRTLRLDGAPVTVVGVVSDIHQGWAERDYRPTLYRPFSQAPVRSFDTLVRTASDPKALLGAARARIVQLDPRQPVYDLNSLRTIIDDTLAGLRYAAFMMATFGLLALLLANVGIYSVMSWAVSERVHEIGVRMALGAGTAQVIGMVLRQGAAVTLGGIVLGAFAAAAAAQSIRNLLFGVGATDLASFVSVIGLLFATAMLACYLPARHASHVDPMITLRQE